jgi:ribosomal protein L11 methyltransferase
LAKEWPALDIHLPGCDPELQDLVLAELDEFQPTAIQEQEDARPLRAFFTTAEARDRAARALSGAFGHHIFIKSTDVEDENWAARSQAALGPITVGRITVAPPWDLKGSGSLFPDDSEKKAPGPFSVVIQPSMGFGTGHHATTRLMLKALQRLDVFGRTLLDIGCGSGVLAIAGARLGATSALGIDIDPDALESAAENVALNNAGDSVHLEARDFREISSPAAIVLANLTGGLLEKHAAPLARLVEPGGYLVVSGFMDTEGGVIPALRQFLTLQSADREEEWQCAVFKKEGGGSHAP